MIIRLLGTGAAEGIPAFCSGTRVSEYARQVRGREIRSRACALVDGHIKIDLPPDTLMQLQRDGLDASDWSGVVFTHSHDDHFAYAELQYALWPFNENAYVPFTVYGNDNIIQEVENYYPDWPIELVTTHSFEPFQHCEYTITPIRANHLDDEDSQNFIFERDGKSILYATDTGIWQDESWEYLASVKLDALILECTKGFSEDSYTGHLSIKDFIKVTERLRKQGTLAETSMVVTTHHSHNGDATHEDLLKALTPRGVVVGYDGLEIEI
jgi:phosphoribosyl 1,2-cyclic phosphate phosphodiesterase